MVVVVNKWICWFF